MVVHGDTTGELPTNRRSDVDDDTGVIGEPATGPPGTAVSRARTWLGDAAVLVGLSGLAITQPLLELLGDNPTFFVAGRYEPGQIVALAVTVAFVPPLLVFLATAVPGLIVRRLASPVHALGVAALTALFVVMVCRTQRVDGVVYVVTLAVMCGAAVAVAEWRSTLARRFLTYLAAGNVAFLLMFLFASPSADLLREPVVMGQQGERVVPPLDGPVVLMIFDELPVTTLMRPDGTINATRYPNFARLAERSTWFRNAAAEAPVTYMSTPTILSGVRASGGQKPTLDEHPRTYFTLFGDRYPVNSYEKASALCPEDVCEPPPSGSFAGLIDDTVLVYQHRVLPPAWRGGLPAVEGGWGDFRSLGELTDGGDAPATSTSLPEEQGSERDAAMEEENSQPGQVAVLRRQVSLISAEPSVNFVHVMLPHHPYLLTPWGERTIPRTWLPDEMSRGTTALPPADDPGYEFTFQQVYALQSMQIGVIDQLVGETIDHLDATGAWDDALLVVTSDHGIDTTPPGFTRRGDATNTDELYRIPLFIKAPGQSTGRIDDAPASTVDVLPSIVDLLDVDADWRFEGHSLFDGSQPLIERRVTSDVDAAVAVAAAHAERYPRGEGWADLAAVGEAEDLVGDRVGDHVVGVPSERSWIADQEDLLADLSVSDGRVPYLMRGTVTGSEDRPPQLVISLNGRIAGAVGAYRRDDDGWLMSGVMAPYFVDGPNDVVAYEVERSGGTVTLHPLRER